MKLPHVDEANGVELEAFIGHRRLFTRSGVLVYKFELLGIYSCWRLGLENRGDTEKPYPQWKR